jgi:hypothetical protein
MGSSARQEQGWWRWGYACGVAAALACSERAPVCHGPRCQQLDVHVLTWWPNTTNSPARPLAEAARQQPGVGGVTLNERNSKTAMVAELESVLRGAGATTRVDTFLANAGRDVLRWTQCGGASASEQLLRTQS